MDSELQCEYVAAAVAVAEVVQKSMNCTHKVLRDVVVEAVVVEVVAVEVVAVEVVEVVVERSEAWSAEEEGGEISIRVTITCFTGLHKPIMFYWSHLFWVWPVI